jgi:hypothetical protein
MSQNVATDAPWMRWAAQFESAVALRLQRIAAEAVEVTRRMLILVAVAAPAFAAGSFLTPPVISSLSPRPIACRSDDFDEGHGTVDAYGNEVSNAVAEYSPDCGDGSYEVHSPKTELPHLASPES